MRYHLKLIRMAIIKKSTNNKFWRWFWENESSCTVWWECKLIQPLRKMVWRFLKKLGIKPPSVQFSSVQFSRSVMSNSLRTHGPQHSRPRCPSPTSRVYSNSFPLNRWCHPTISSSVIPFSCCPQSLPASGSFPMSQLFAWGGQSIGVSALASVLPMNTQDWSPLGWTG